MAESGKSVTTTVASGSTPNSRFYFKWSLSSQNTTGNTSTISWECGWEGTTGAPQWGSNAIKITEGEVAGAGISTGTWSNQSGTGEHSLRSGTATISHDSDGTGSFSAWMTGWFYDVGSLSLSGSWSLPAIPRGSSTTVSKTTLGIGDTQTVTISRASTSYWHDVDYYVAGTYIGSNKNVATSATFVIPTTVAALAANTTSATCVAYVWTNTGSTSNPTIIAQSSITFTITIPDTDTYKPSFTASLSRVDGSVPSSWGVYVQGYSKWKVALSSAAAGSGATLKTWSITDGANTGGGALASASANYTSNILTATGKTTITVTVTDTRGRTTSKTLTIDDVKAYSAPTITPQVAYRVNSSGTKTFNGTYASIQASWAYASVASKNSVTYTLDYKTIAATTWTTQSITLTSGTRATVGDNKLAATSSYHVRLTVKDGLGQTAQYTWQLGTAQVDLDFREDRKGMGIGCVGETSDTLEIGWAVNLQKGLKTPLPLSSGGTGKAVTTAPSLLVNLASTTAASPYDATPRPGVTNVLPKTYGGTGSDKGIVAVKTGNWYEERLGDNFYRWTQIYTTSAVSITSAWGSWYYVYVALPTKPSGATITSVSASCDGPNEETLVYTILSSWQATLIRPVAGASYTRRLAIVAYGTK